MSGAAPRPTGIPPWPIHRPYASMPSLTLNKVRKAGNCLSVLAVALTNSMSSAAINPAPKPMTGSRPKKKCFTLRNNRGLRTGAHNVDTYTPQRRASVPRNPEVERLASKVGRSRTTFGSRGPMFTKTPAFRENRSVRKRIVSSDRTIAGTEPGSHWMDLGRIATVEVTSEDPDFPIESAFSADGGPGWRASQKGEQQIRLVLHPI